MMLRVGLKTGDLVNLDHREIQVTSKQDLVVVPLAGSAPRLECAAGCQLTIQVADGKIVVASDAGRAVYPAAGLRIERKAAATEALLNVRSKATAKSSATPPMTYRGVLEIRIQAGHLRPVLVTDLESYVQGVLQSEVPAYFELEAMKAQAVLARSYGLRPRLPHGSDGFDVCDSYLHCQAFYGVKTLSNMQKLAIAQTRGQILTYKGQPALALFSACAGGHTEDYENCFSDPVTGAFPPAPIPYLKGVAEGALPCGYPDENALRQLFREPRPDTVDAWSMGHFRWQVQLKADSIEAHMHHVLAEMRKDAQFAPFIKPPKSQQFGHVQRFVVTRRGVAGTAIGLEVHTSTGVWLVEKELAIRSLFSNPDASLKRLRSARIFFDYACDSNQLLSAVTISGFGSGHAVGLQQIGAQGLAKRGKDYRQIIEHYYPGTEVKPVH